MCSTSVIIVNESNEGRAYRHALAYS